GVVRIGRRLHEHVGRPVQLVEDMIKESPVSVLIPSETPYDDLFFLQFIRFHLRPSPRTVHSASLGVFSVYSKVHADVPASDCRPAHGHTRRTASVLQP